MAHRRNNECFASRTTMALRWLYCTCYYVNNSEVDNLFVVASEYYTRQTFRVHKQFSNTFPSAFMFITYNLIQFLVQIILKYILNKFRRLIDRAVRCSGNLITQGQIYLYSTASKIFHFSLLDPDYPTR
jgi:hypothetical protein